MAVNAPSVTQAMPWVTKQLRHPKLNETREVSLSKFSVFEYFYRDASNYKSWGFVLLSGAATSCDIEKLTSHLESGCYFIAEQLCLPPLYAELWAFSNGRTSDDHVWHTSYSLRAATAPEMEAPVFGEVEKLIQRNVATSKWDATLSPHWDI